MHAVDPSLATISAARVLHVARPNAVEMVMDVAPDAGRPLRQSWYAEHCSVLSVFCT